MIKFIPTIAAKNVIEAIELYKDTFNATIGRLVYNTDVPGSSEIKEQDREILHAELLINNAPILHFTEEASDQNQYTGKTIYGNNITLVANFETEEEISNAYNKLKKAEGSKIIVELGDAFWGAKFGCVKDKFNVIWNLNCDKK